jgi:hypothetical protein
VSDRFRLLPDASTVGGGQQSKQRLTSIEAGLMQAIRRLLHSPFEEPAMSNAARTDARPAAATIPAEPSVPAERLQQDASAQLALTELFPHLRHASDDALRDIIISLRVPAARSPAAA